MDVRSERRIVTCLFVDVVGSTDAMMRLGPELMQRRLAEAFDQMSGRIAAHGGTVEKYVGDAIFALFGAPTAHVDDAERALRAAEACASWSSTGSLAGDRLAIRVGIETGDALVDLAASEKRERMAIGSCVTIAARLQQQADPGEIVVGPTCHQATAAVGSFEPMASVELKGLGEIEPWRFTGFGPTEAALAVPFVGREAELQLLRDAAQKAAQGSALLALIVGSPGLGKSRLAEEAIQIRREAGPLRVIQLRCRPGTEVGTNTPLRQLIEADVPDATPDAVRDRLSHLLGEADGAITATAISHSGGLAADPRLLAVGRHEQRELIAGAWRRYLAALALEEPLVVSIEDLHWADPVFVRTIDHVTSDLDAPILIIATARPEFVGSAHLGPSENRLQIDLTPLDVAASAMLAEAARPGVAGLERAAGNPLFIIELARSRSTGTDLPLTIQAAIAARLDELSPAERHLLQHAAVAGETFDVRDAALLDDREPADAAGMLGRIAHLGFVAPVGSSYRFHHALVHDVAYGRLPVAERMTLHARYAQDGVAPSDVEARAHHLWEAVSPVDASWVWQESGDLTDLRSAAFDAQIASGARLEERNQYEQATGVYERAVTLASDAAKLGDAQASLGRTFARQGRGDEAWEHRLAALAAYREAATEAPSKVYADMLEVATMNWGYFERLPDDAEVMRLLEEGERNARSSGDDVSLARLLMERGAFTGDASIAHEVVGFVHSPEALRFADPAQRTAMVYLWAGQIDSAMELYGTVFDELVPGGAVINEPEALLWYGVAAFQAGDLDRTETLANRAQEDAIRRSVHTRQHVLGLQALLSFGRGDWDRVLRATRELDELVEANPDATFCLVGGASIGYAAAARIVTRQELPADLAAYAERMISESALIQAGCIMLPKAMLGEEASFEQGLAAYAPRLRLYDRVAVWDICHLMPALGLTMLERWDQLEGPLARLDECAAGGGRLAAAAATAIREEHAAAQGGPEPAHEELRSLGFAGISELLHFRPTEPRPGV